MTEFFTPKQKQLISDFKHDRLKRINILDGSVRSGKTWITCALWGLWVATMPIDKTYLMTARTLTTRLDRRGYSITEFREEFKDEIKAGKR